MKKILFLLFFLSLVFIPGFANKDVSNNTICGPWVNIHNNTQSVFDINLWNGDADESYYDLAPGTITSTGQWSNGMGFFVVKLLFVSPQNGSIKIYQGSTLINCIPTYANQYSRYDFDFNVSGCLVYTIKVTNDPC